MAATKDRWKHIPFTVGVAIPFRAIFSLEEFDRIREGMMPEAMEDKWFGYFEEPHLFLHRSWGGQPVYRVALIAHGDGVAVAEALCVAEVLAKSTPEYEAKLLDFLISNLILGYDTPFPRSPPSRRRWWRWR
jgi:hypothetical protein